MRRSSLVAVLLASVAAQSQDLRIPLPSTWSLRSEEGRVTIDAHVPGCVQLDLHRAGLAPDPTLDPHAAIFGWAEARAWTYRIAFHMPDTIFAHQRADLVFEGLDTHAEVFLNGHSVFTADNQFRTWRTDVRSLVRPGSNTLEVVFAPSVSVGKEARSRSGLPLPHDSDTSGAAPFVRKAGYQFGWDFAPRMVTTGIFKPVYIHAWSGARLEGTRIDQRQSGNFHEVTVEPHIEFASLDTGSLRAVLVWKGLQRDEVVLDPRGGSTPVLRFVDEGGPRWWPQGEGGHPLHPLEVQVRQGERVLARCERSIGLRTVALDRSPHALGTAYRFIVNGRPVFMRGANVVPPGVLPSAMDDRAWVALVAHAQRAGMNMLRVWAGGIYPPDAFFLACDTAGILVWQDLMFSHLVPDDTAYLHTARAEVMEQALRIGAFTSLASWCGNNELEVAWKHWGWPQRYRMDEAVQQRIADTQRRFFHDSIPRWLATLGGTPYVPTTPLSNWGSAEGLRHGSLHYWGVWHADSTFASYAGNVGRFVSEFGFQSYPDPVVPDAAGFSQLRERQGSYRGDGPIRRAILHEFGREPADDAEWVTWSQLAQAQALRLGIVSHRAMEPTCMGSLFWQLNDVWPAPSWSTVDHAGRWKAAQYAVVRANRPLALALDARENEVRITAVHPATAHELQLRVQAWSLAGEVMLDTIRALHVGTPGSQLILPVSERLRSGNAVLFATLTDGAGEEATEAVVLRPPPGGPLSNVTFHMEPVDNGVTRVEVTTATPRAVVLLAGQGIDLPDNVFPLAPGHQRSVLVHHAPGWDPSALTVLAWP